MREHKDFLNLTDTLVSEISTDCILRARLKIKNTSGAWEESVQP